MKELKDELVVLLLNLFMKLKVWNELYSPVLFTLVEMDRKNRMFRPISVGLNDNRWYVRTDWWKYGVRLTLKKDKEV